MFATIVKMWRILTPRGQFIRTSISSSLIQLKMDLGLKNKPMFFRNYPRILRGRWWRLKPKLICVWEQRKQAKEILCFSTSMKNKTKTIFWWWTTWILCQKLPHFSTSAKFICLKNHWWKNSQSSPTVSSLCWRPKTKGLWMERWEKCNKHKSVISFKLKCSWGKYPFRECYKSMKIVFCPTKSNKLPRGNNLQMFALIKNVLSDSWPLEDIVSKRKWKYSKNLNSNTKSFLNLFGLTEFATGMSQNNWNCWKRKRR